MNIDELKEEIVERAKNVNDSFILVFPRQEKGNKESLDNLYKKLLEVDKPCYCECEGVAYPTFSKKKDLVEIIDIARQYKTYTALYGIDSLPEKAKIGTIKLSDLKGRLGLMFKWLAYPAEHQNQITLYDFLIDNFLDDFYIEISSTSPVHKNFIQQWLSLEDYGQKVITPNIWDNYICKYPYPEKRKILDSFLPLLGGPHYYAFVEESIYEYIISKLAELHSQYPLCNIVNLARFNPLFNKKMAGVYRRWKNTLAKTIPGVYVFNKKFSIAENEFFIDDSFTCIRLSYQEKGKKKPQEMYWYYDIFVNEWRSSLTDYDYISSVLESGMLSI